MDAQAEIQKLISDFVETITQLALEEAVRVLNDLTDDAIVGGVRTTSYAQNALDTVQIMRRQRSRDAKKRSRDAKKEKIVELKWEGKPKRKRDLAQARDANRAWRLRKAISELRAVFPEDVAWLEAYEKAHPKKG